VAEAFKNTDERINDPIFAPRQLYDLDYLRDGRERPADMRDENLVPVDDPSAAALATSRIRPGVTSVDGGLVGSTEEHLPCFDLDFPFGSIKALKSASGNTHLYFNVPMEWPDVVKLLTVMGEVGLLQPGYVKACIAQGMTRLRMPGVVKAPAKWGHYSEVET
jgi:hypothetical protein